MDPTPSPHALRAAVRHALARGLPPADAEDVAAQAWERAQASFDARRGTFDALYQSVARTLTADWWRVRRRRAEVALSTEPAGRPPSERLEQVHRNQQRLLDALDADERRLFATWALQKHLPQGQLTAPRAAASLGCTVADFNNAKRRLHTKIRTLADAWGLEPRDFFSCDEHEGPRRRTHAAR